MLSGLLLVAPLLLAVVFAVAGLGKLLDRKRSRRAIEAFGTRARLSSRRAPRAGARVGRRRSACAGAAGAVGHGRRAGFAGALWCGADRSTGSCGWSPGADLRAPEPRPDARFARRIDSGGEVRFAPNASATSRFCASVQTPRSSRGFGASGPRLTTTIVNSVLTVRCHFASSGKAQCCKPRQRCTSTKGSK
jgi:hypothetical protein